MLHLCTRPPAPGTIDFVFVEPLGGAPKDKSQVVRPRIPQAGVEVTNRFVVVAVRCCPQGRLADKYLRHLVRIIREIDHQRVKVPNRRLHGCLDKYPLAVGGRPYLKPSKSCGSLSDFVSDALNVHERDVLNTRRQGPHAW